MSVVVTTCLFTASHERTRNVTFSPCASRTVNRDKHQIIKKNLIFITIFCLTIPFSGVQNYNLFWNMPKIFREIEKSLERSQRTEASRKVMLAVWSVEKRV